MSVVSQESIGTPPFNDPKIAFHHLTTPQLRWTYYLFKAMTIRWLIEWGPRVVNFCFRIHLPISPIIKATLFKQFCGGETLDECRRAIALLAQNNVGTILDFAVEAGDSEEAYAAAEQEILATIQLAKSSASIRFAVFKMTGIASTEVLEKVTAGQPLDDVQEESWKRIKARVDRLCAAAAAAGIRIFIDAEESWLQGAIDQITEEMIHRHNRERPVVYTTIQFYRHDRLEYLKRLLASTAEDGLFIGVKLVRGAYLEKETQRALRMGLRPPVHQRKQDTDRDFNEAQRLLLDHIERTAICSATHNELSCRLLIEGMSERGIAKNDKRIEFSQLFGMGNHISFFLARESYNVSKYLPYGPVKRVLPYLFRRAQENSSVKGQSSRELALISAEVRRRAQIY